MCGRYVLTSPPQAMREVFGYEEQPNFPPRYNIAPTQPIALVRSGSGAKAQGARHFMLARWGFLPGFVKDPREFPLLINARAEGIESKPSFRAAIRRRRCLVMADGWYEWQKLKDARGRAMKRPFFFRRADGAPIGFAGLYETWSDPAGGEVDTACIVTTDAAPELAVVHERMPALIEPANFARWLDCSDDKAGPEILGLLRPSRTKIAFHPVDPRVGRVAEEGPGLIEDAR